VILFLPYCRVHKGFLFPYSQKIFHPPIDELKEWWYIIFAIGSEELSQRMEKRASV